MMISLSLTAMSASIRCVSSHFFFLFLFVDAELSSTVLASSIGSIPSIHYAGEIRRRLLSGEGEVSPSLSTWLTDRSLLPVSSISSSPSLSSSQEGDGHLHLISEEIPSKEESVLSYCGSVLPNEKDLIVALRETDREREKLRILVSKQEDMIPRSRESKEEDIYATSAREGGAGAAAQTPTIQWLEVASMDISISSEGEGKETQKGKATSSGLTSLTCGGSYRKITGEKAGGGGGGIMYAIASVDVIESKIMLRSWVLTLSPNTLSPNTPDTANTKAEKETKGPIHLHGSITNPDAPIEIQALLSSLSPR